MEDADRRLAVDGGDAKPHAPPFVVSLAPFSPSSTRRLSAAFLAPPSPSPSRLAWLSLQGRLVNANEASSARTIGGNLRRDEAVAWELFDPIHRFLIVAVIGASVAQSHKNHQIWRLQKSVELRDQVLLSMQQKLDNLCEELDKTKEHSVAAISNSFTKSEESTLNETIGSENFKFVDCGCWLCDQHCESFHGLMQNSSATRVSGGNEVVQYKMPFSNEEQEERRMSDLSDWASSVTSAADVQLNNSAIEQDIYNLKRDCEEKDTTIKELTNLLNSSGVAISKREAELEDIIRRKNSTITKLKKDLVVLEQKVIQLSRLRRPSFSACESKVGTPTHLRDNLLYDMESSTSPSSSDSDSTPSNRAQDLALKADVLVLNEGSVLTNCEKSMPEKAFSVSEIATEQPSKLSSSSPLKEISTNWKFDTASSSSSLPRQLSVRGDLTKSRRRPLSSSKRATVQKRWV